MKRRLAAFVLAAAAASAALGIGAQPAGAASGVHADGRSSGCIVILKWSICIPSLYP